MHLHFAAKARSIDPLGDAPKLIIGLIFSNLYLSGYREANIKSRIYFFVFYHQYKFHLLFLGLY